MPNGTNGAGPTLSPINAMVRSAQPEDMPAVYDLMKTVLLEFYAPRYPQLVTWGEKHFGARNCKPEHCGLFLVAEWRGQIIGCVMLGLHAVFNLYIEQSWRGKGLGSQLLNAAEQRLQKRGIVTAVLEVAEDFPKVVAFYQGQGWSLTGTAHKSLRDVPVVVMSKRLLTGKVGAAWLLCHRLIRPILVAAICVASYPYAYLFLGAGGLPPGLFMAVWLLMAALGIRNLLTIPAQLFYPIRCAAVIVLGTALQMAVLQSVPTVALLVAPLVELPAGRHVTGIFSAILGLAITLRLLNDLLRRPMTRAWRRFGFEIPN